MRFLSCPSSSCVVWNWTSENSFQRKILIEHSRKIFHKFVPADKSKHSERREREFGRKKFETEFKSPITTWRGGQRKSQFETRAQDDRHPETSTSSAAAAATGDNSTDQITIVFSSFYNPINANYNVRLLDHLAW